MKFNKNNLKIFHHLNIQIRTLKPVLRQGQIRTRKSRKTKTQNFKSRIFIDLKTSRKCPYFRVKPGTLLGMGGFWGLIGEIDQGSIRIIN